MLFQGKVSLYNPGYPRIHFVDQAGLKLKDTPASASRVLVLNASAVMPGGSVSLCASDLIHFGLCFLGHSNYNLVDIFTFSNTFGSVALLYFPLSCFPMF